MGVSQVSGRGDVPAGGEQPRAPGAAHASSQPRERLRAYEPLPVPFRFEDLPEHIEEDGRSVPNPVRQTAVFVVHGMGLQRFPETAVTLRSGFEDAIGEITAQYPTVRVPPPFVYEGYWADYADFAESFPECWKQCSSHERRFFGALWERRSMRALATAGWFVRQNLRLWFRRAVWNLGFFRALALIAMAPLTVLAVLAMLVRYPRLLREVLSDVRIYCDPRGDVETAIVQRIDYRVGAAFLMLLGLDWDFRDLPPERQWEISGSRHSFTYVTWTAHSLGTVISYNVIGDLLRRAEDSRRELDQRARSRAPGEPEPDEDRRLRLNVEKVERGLHRFVTLGSPLEQIDGLFSFGEKGERNTVLREWPEEARKRLSSSGRSWWANFYHVWDPVSGPLQARRFQGVVANYHGALWRLPLLAHMSYWRDVAILKHVVSRAFGPKLCRWRDPDFLSRPLVVLRFLTAVAALLGVLAVVGGLAWWLVSGAPGQVLWKLVSSGLGA